MAPTRETISQYFYMPISLAAKQLNVSLTVFKKQCRQVGIERWPYPKLKSLQNMITHVQVSNQLKFNFYSNLHILSNTLTHVYDNTIVNICK